MWEPAGNGVGLRRCWKGGWGSSGGTKEAVSHGSGVRARGGGSARSVWARRAPGTEQALLPPTPRNQKSEDPTPDSQRLASRGRRPKGHLVAGAAGGASSTTRGAALLKAFPFSGRLAPDCISGTKTMRTLGLNYCSDQGRGSF